MTTAHRPTFDPARGKEAQRGVAYHQRLLPAHKTLKYRVSKPDGARENQQSDLREQLLLAESAAEAAGTKSHRSYAKSSLTDDQQKISELSIETESTNEEESPEERKARIIAATKEIDKDDSDISGPEDTDEDDESEDETAELMREMEKIKRERAEQRLKEEEEARSAHQEPEFARENPLLAQRDFGVKRRWDDDVVFKNQARGTEGQKGKEFVNDLLRSDFHKRFMSRYIR